MSWHRSRCSTCVRSWFVLIAALGLLILAGCSENSSGEVAQQEHSQKQKKPSQQAIPVAVTIASSGSISSYYQATATLEAEKQAQVLARVTGVVKTLLAEEGDMVSKGDPLLLVENDEYRFRVEQATATTTNLRSRYQRLEQMVAEELATQEEIQSARSDLASAEAE